MATATATATTRTTRQAAPLPTLSVPAQRSAEGCRSCGSTRVTALVMTLTDGTLVDFVNCRACERRAWRQDGRDLPITEVLERTRKPR